MNTADIASILGLTSTEQTRLDRLPQWARRGLENAARQVREQRQIMASYLERGDFTPADIYGFTRVPAKVQMHSAERASHGLRIRFIGDNEVEVSGGAPGLVYRPSAGNVVRIIQADWDDA